jgi:cytochrome c1
MQKPLYGLYVLTIPFLIALIAILASVGRNMPVAPTQAVVGGDPVQGMNAITTYGCGTCHTIPGINGADGVVGPPLNNFAQRLYIAGKLSNTRSNLVQWIRYPQELDPGVDMPDMGVPEAAANDIAAYLYTLK